MADRSLDIDLYAVDVESDLNRQDEFHGENFDLYDDVIVSPPVKTEEGDGFSNSRPHPVEQTNGNSNFHNNQNHGHHGRRFFVYIGNLTWWTTDDDIVNAIADIGITDFQEVKFFEKKSNGQSKGFCMVSVGSEKSRFMALERLPKKEVHGQLPIVTLPTKQALSQFENQSQMRSAPFGPNFDMRGPHFVMGGPRGPPHHGDFYGSNGPGPNGANGPRMMHGLPDPHHQMRAPPHHMQHQGHPPSHHMQHQGPPPSHHMQHQGPPPSHHMQHQGPPPSHHMQHQGPPPSHHMQRQGHPPHHGPPIHQGHPLHQGPPPHQGLPLHRSPMEYQGPPQMQRSPGPHGSHDCGPRGPPQYMQPQPGPQYGMPHHQVPPPHAAPPQGLPPSHHQLPLHQQSPLRGPAPMPQHQVLVPGGPAPHVNPAFLNQQPPVQPAPGVQPPPQLAPDPGTPYGHPPPSQGLPPGARPPYGIPPQAVVGAAGISEAEFEEVMSRNRTVSSSAIARAVSDAAAGEYASAIETLVTAVSLIKQSKVAHDDRCQILISSLQDTLRGVESKSYSGERRRSRSRERQQRAPKRRERSASRYRSRDRDRDRDRERYKERSRDRDRERDAHYREYRERERDRSRSRDNYNRGLSREERAQKSTAEATVESGGGDVSAVKSRSSAVSYHDGRHRDPSTVDRDRDRHHEARH